MSRACVANARCTCCVAPKSRIESALWVVIVDRFGQDHPAPRVRYAAIATEMVRRRDVSQGANRVYEVTTDQNRTTSRSNS